MKNILGLLFFGIILFAGTACEKDETPEEEETPIETLDCTTVTFAGTIFPLVQANCANDYCHGGSGAFPMLNYAQVKAKADNGKIESRVLDIKDMPQGGSLTSEELGQIKCWLDAGAPDN